MSLMLTWSILRMFWTKDSLPVKLLKWIINYKLMFINLKKRKTWNSRSEKPKAQTIKSFLRANIPQFFFAAGSASMNLKINVCIFYFTPRTLLFWFCGILLNKLNNNNITSKWNNAKERIMIMWKNAPKKKDKEVTTIANSSNY